MRLIDADALIEQIEKIYDGYLLEDNCSAWEFIRRIEDAPTIKHNYSSNNTGTIINNPTSYVSGE